MGAVTTPSGETIYVPDGLLGTFAAPAGVPMPSPPPMGVGGLDPSIMASLGLGPAPMSGSVPSGAEEVPLPLGTQPTQQPHTPPVHIATPAEASTIAQSPGAGDHVAGLVDAMGKIAVPTAPALAAAGIDAGGAPVAPPGAKPPRAPDDIAQAQSESIAGLGQQMLGEQNRATNNEQAADEAARALDQRSKNVLHLQDQQAAAEKLRQNEIAKRQEQYSKSVDAFAQTKIDDGRRWRNLDTGSKIMAGISVGLSVIGQALMKQGGPNPAIQIIDQAIRDDVAAQVRDREGKKELVGVRKSSLDDYLAQSKDLRQAEALKVAEEYKRTADQMELIAARHKGADIEGSAQMMAGEFRQKAAAVIAHAGEARWNRDVKQQELSNAKASIGVQYAHLSQAERFHKDEMEQRDAQLSLERQKLVAAAAAHGDAKLAEDIDKKAIGGVPEEIKDKDGNVTGVRYGLIKQSDGKTVWIPNGTPESVSRLRDQISATEQITKVMDDVRRLRTGWSNSAHDREEFQRIRSSWDAGKVAFKNLAALGALSESDYDLMNGAMGTSDPTKLLDQGPGIDQSRKTLVSFVNTSAHRAGLDHDLDFPDRSVTPEVQKDKLDTLHEAANALTGGEEHSAVIAFGGGGGAATLLKRGGDAAREQALRTIAAGAQSDNPKLRDRSLELLRETASKGSTQEIRDLADQLLGAIVTPSQASLERPTSGSSVSYETVPPAPRKK